MRVYLEVARLSFRRYSTYRISTVAGVFTNTVFGFILVSVLRTALGSRSIGGLTADKATAFTFVTQGLLMVTMAFGDFEHVDRVRTGEVAVELLRPLDYSMYRLSGDLGRSAFALVARGLPPFLVGWLVYRFEVPDPGRMALFLVAVVGGAMVASRGLTVVATLAFWMTDGSGAMQIATAFNLVACGATIPLQFYPDGVLWLLRLSPWAATIQRPVEVYLGLSGLLPVVAAQLFWIVVLEGVLRVELRAAQLQLVVNGG